MSLAALGAEMVRRYGPHWDQGGTMESEDVEIATDVEVTRAVLLALKERVLLGDKLAEGAVKVIERLTGEAS